MGWNDYHQHAFQIGSATYGVPDPEGGWNVANERGRRVDDAIAPGTGRFTYVYDFGDDWIHDVIVRAVTPPVQGIAYPRILDARRACPPEDVGGVPGFEAFLEAFNDSTHDDHAELVSWVGGRYDPEVVDIDAVRARLARLGAAATAKVRKPR